jgi:AMP deaminase
MSSEWSFLNGKGSWTSRNTRVRLYCSRKLTPIVVRLGSPTRKNVENSPYLGPSRLSHAESLSDDDAYQLPHNMETSSQGSHELDHHFDDGDNHQNSSPDDFALLDSAQEGILARDRQRKTAFYDHAAEKKMTHEESKLFYQQHQLEGQSNGRSSRAQQHSIQGSPVLHSSQPVHNGGARASRSGSIKSRQSNWSQVQDNTGTVSLPYRKVAPTGLASLDKPVDSTDVQQPEMSSFDPSHPDSEVYRRENAAPHADSTKPLQDAAGPAHVLKPELHVSDGISGIGAGVGVGSGVGGFASNDSSIHSELSAIYQDIQKVLDIRHKYIRLSLQGTNDNPKDDPRWDIYPPPPASVWDEGRQRPKAPGTATGSNSMSSSFVLPPRADSSIGDAPQYQEKPKKRKAGEDVGTDFHMDDLLPLPEAGEMTFRLNAEGVFEVFETNKSAELNEPIVSIPTIRDYFQDLECILHVSSDGPNKSFAFRRLQYLEGKFNLYVLLNEYQEMADSKRVPHRDFYNVRKVDTHVHHSACMNQKHLLRFIKSKMKKCPDETVLFRDGKNLTLREVFESINLTAYDLSIDTLDMHV